MPAGPMRRTGPAGPWRVAHSCRDDGSGGDDLISQRPARHRGELNWASAIIQYEVTSMAQFLVLAGSGSCEEYEERAALEAGLLHARSMIEFLVGRGRRRDSDMAPEDFVA